MESLYNAYDIVCSLWCLLSVVLMKVVTALAPWELGREICCHFLNAVLSERQSGRLNHNFLSCGYSMKTCKDFIETSQVSVAM